MTAQQGYRFGGQQTRDEQGRLVCPECGCPDLRVVNTWHSGGEVKRRRECRHCGHAFLTIEQKV